MTTTILPPRETAVLRSVAKSAAVLFTLMFIERTYPGRASSELEIAAIMRMDTRTVRRQLTGLSAAGLVSLQGAERWMLTPEGRGTLFPETPIQPVLSIEETTPHLSASDSAAQIVHLDRLDREITTINVKNLSSISQDCTICAEIPQILQAAAELLNCEISVHEIMLKREPEFVLGWIAKAYADMNRPGSTLRSPGGLVFRRLLELTPLPVMYQKNPVRGLPAEFLREIGMVAEAEKLEDRAEQAESQKVDMTDYLRKLNEQRNQLVEYVYPEQEECDGYGRNLRWLEIINDPRWDSPARNKEKRGISFVGSEQVRFEGDCMVVSVESFGENEKDNAARANEWHAENMSAIYAEQSSNPSARVVFVNQEVSA